MFPPERRHRGVLFLVGLVVVASLILFWAKSGHEVPIIADAVGLIGEASHPPAASCTDGIRNQDESDVDCGGNCNACATGASCRTDQDCGFRMICNNGACRQLEWRTDNCRELLPGHNDANAENLNIVFVGAGYGNTDDFVKDAQRAVETDPMFPQQHPGLFFYEPMKSYKDKINVWYVDQIPPLQPQTGATDCRTLCKSTIGEEYCPSLNRQVIYLCDAKCDASAELGGDLYVGKSTQQPFEVVHGFGHSYGFLPEVSGDSLMGNYLRILGKQATPNDFDPEAKAQIAERLGRYRGKEYAPWDMIWVVLDQDLNIVAAREAEQSIGETRRLPAQYILRLNGGSLSYVFDFDRARTIITDRSTGAEVQKQTPRFIEVPLPLKISKLTTDKLKLDGYKGVVEPYTVDIIGPSGELLKRLPAEELAKFLRK